MSEKLALQAADGSGSFSAYAAVPKATPAPAIIVIQEIFGVNKNLRDICDKFAAEGYFAVCPDLFWRQEPGIDITDQTEAEWKKAFALFNGFDVGKGIGDLKTTLAAVRAHPACNGKAGTVGFCLGGKLAYLMATRSNADCNVSYYGVGLQDLLGESGNIKKPLLLHIAELDGFSSPEARAQISAGLKDNAHVEMHVYAGVDHAFTRIGGKNFNAGATKLAHGRTAAFFKNNLQ
ncbi:MAG: dienelactone hydrolase family protein [Alphaproteobacteria bacterium]|nr:dienelactone hydrolase family protein [Alphaproteobacteria bacterium]MDE2335965.1 dienelactone hydrolase family protein [Alphaproteobacteria bacterium]